MTPDSPLAKLIIELAVAGGLPPERAAALAQEAALTEQKYNAAAEDLARQVTSMMKAWGRKWRLDPAVQGFLLAIGFCAAATSCMTWANEHAPPKKEPSDA